MLWGARLRCTLLSCSHVSPMHLGANLLGLYFFGRDVGQLFGGRKASLGRVGDGRGTECWGCRVALWRGKYGGKLHFLLLRLPGAARAIFGLPAPAPCCCAWPLCANGRALPSLAPAACSCCCCTWRVAWRAHLHTAAGTFTRPARPVSGALLRAALVGMDAVAEQGTGACAAGPRDLHRRPCSWHEHHALLHPPGLPALTPSLLVAWLRRRRPLRPRPLVWLCAARTGCLGGGECAGGCGHPAIPHPHNPSVW